MKRFQVPLQRRENIQETFSSETDVLVLPQRSDRISHVERVRLKLHNSKDEFAVYTYGWSFGKEASKPHFWFKAPLTKLGRVSPGTPVLLRVDPHRPQLCFTKEGYLHAVKSRTRGVREGNVSAWSFCGESLSDVPLAHVQQGLVPTCPECLAEGEWVDFTVGTYEMPDKIRKIQDKEAAERRYRANLPTRFDRLDDEDEEPEVVFVADLDIDPPDPDEPEGRDAKLEARVRQAKRVKDAKRARI